VRKVLVGGTSYKAEYIGGHSLFPKKMKCTLVLAGNGIAIPEMGLNIPYERVNEVRVTTEKDVSILRTILFGPVIGLLWKKKKQMLLLSYTDENGLTQNLVFDVKKKKAEEAAMTIYQRVATAKRS